MRAAPVDVGGGGGEAPCSTLCARHRLACLTQLFLPPSLPSKHVSPVILASLCLGLPPNLNHHSGALLGTQRRAAHTTHTQHWRLPSPALRLRHLQHVCSHRALPGCGPVCRMTNDAAVLLQHRAQNGTGRDAPTSQERKETRRPDEQRQGARETCPTPAAHRAHALARARHTSHPPPVNQARVLGRGCVGRVAWAHAARMHLCGKRSSELATLAAVGVGSHEFKSGRAPCSGW